MKNRSGNIKGIAFAKLSDTFVDGSLSSLIEWLDILHEKDDAVKDLPQQIITRCIIASGYCLLEHISFSDMQREKILNTINAGVEYAIYPNDRNFQSYFSHATDSYPFGAGDGCYSNNRTEVVREIDNDSAAEHCAVGSGCRSGAGSLQMSELDDKVIFKAISEDLLPWLAGDSDPVLENL